jgi:hypothetical protein
MVRETETEMEMFREMVRERETYMGREMRGDRGI